MIHPKRITLACCVLAVWWTSSIVVVTGFATTSTPSTLLSSLASAMRNNNIIINNNHYDKKNSFSSLSNKYPTATVAMASASIPSAQTIQPVTIPPLDASQTLSGLKSGLVRAGMISFILGMCIALPLTIGPQWALYKLGFITRIQKERNVLATGQFCARWLMRIFPFCRIETFPHHDPDPPASIWVSNHSSMLDVFIMLAADLKLRGKKKRPIKIVYWKDLESNPVSKILFQQSGFIPVKMAANKPGEDNQYDRASFKKLLKDSKKAFEEGFDLGLLPEGQLNPAPEDGLLPVFSGAHTLARMSRRPIQMMALHGVHRLWHAEHGMHAIGRRVRVRVYPALWNFKSSEDFAQGFTAVVGHFATHGVDLPKEELRYWLEKADAEILPSTQ